MKCNVKRNSEKANSESLYAKNLRDSLKWFDEFKSAAIKAAGQSIPLEIWHKLFPKDNCNNYVKKVEDINLSTERTAIILLGPSCCGKTTYAKALKEKYPFLETVLFDATEMQIIVNCIKNRHPVSTELVDMLAINEFGKKIEQCAEKNKSIVVDCQCIYSNTRGALLSTLRQLGYKKIVVASFLKIPKEEIIKRIEARALEETYFFIYSQIHKSEDIFSYRLSYMGKDTKPLLLAQKSLEEWKKDPLYQKNLKENLEIFFNIEPIDSCFGYQVHNKLFGYGIDVWYDIF